MWLCRGWYYKMATFGMPIVQWSYDTEIIPAGEWQAQQWQQRMYQGGGPWRANGQSLTPTAPVPPPAWMMPPTSAALPPSSAHIPHPRPPAAVPGNLPGASGQWSGRWEALPQNLASSFLDGGWTGRDLNNQTSPTNSFIREQLLEVLSSFTSAGPGRGRGR